MTRTIEGSHVALPTPFRDGAVDLPALRGLVERQVEGGSAGIVVAGTTGEASTLTEGEFRSLLRAALEAAAGRLQVVAGVGTNDTRTTVERARFASACGADALLVVTPYYNRPSARGLRLHYAAVAAATDTPLVLYNVPRRTGVDLEPALVAELFETHRSVVAVKESTRSPERIAALCAIPGLAVLCGEDERLLEFAAAGAAGAVSVVGNLVPRSVVRLLDAARPEAERALAERIARELEPLVRALTLDVNPVPLKAALAELGWCSDEVCLPLAALDAPGRTALADVLRRCEALGAPAWA